MWCAGKAGKAGKTGKAQWLVITVTCRHIPLTTASVHPPTSSNLFVQFR